MFKELDVVKSSANLSEHVSKECVGTIVMVYDKPSLAYEVEFFDGDGDTIELLTVKPSDIVSI